MGIETGISGTPPIPAGTFAPSGSGGSAALVLYTVGDIVVNGVAWADLNNALDLVINGKVGDMVEVGMSARWTAEAVFGLLDAVSIVAAAPVNNWSKGAAESNSTSGVDAWMGPASADKPFGGSVMKALVAGDISGGQVRIRFRVRTGSAANKTLLADSNDSLKVFAVNHG